MRSTTTKGRSTGHQRESSINLDDSSAICAPPGVDQPVCETVAAAVEQYLADLGDAEPSCIYDLVMREVERPLLQTVLAHAGGNRSKASKYLGMNRNTLRKKLEQYQIGD